MQDPDLATRELVRCVENLKFRGALVNGFSQVGDLDTVAYYDLPRYRPFWATVERLDVPFYLHPRNPIPAWSQIYEGHPWLLGRPGRLRRRPPCMRYGSWVAVCSTGIRG